jgi:hypothetical protein
MQKLPKPLEKYMNKYGISISVFADMADISINYVFRLKKRYRGSSPSISMMERIMKVTNGEIKPGDWMSYE